MSSGNASGSDGEYPEAFTMAVNRVLRDEGGYSNKADDAGGETKYGISKRQYPELAIATLTRAAAVAIYYRDWWQRFGYAGLPAAIGMKMFDLAVNIGPAETNRCLQRALRACGIKIADDGVLGEASKAAAGTANQLALMAALRSEAAGHYRALVTGDESSKERFLEGWLNRAYE